MVSRGAMMMTIETIEHRITAYGKTLGQTTVSTLIFSALALEDFFNYIAACSEDKDAVK